MRPIDADDLQKSLNDYVFNDPTCPLHIAATVDQYIDFAPTVDAGEWIPCSERLPEGGREVLAVCNGFDGTGNPKQMYVLAAIENGRWIETWGLAALAFDVVKWKYTPELNGGAYNA